MKKITLTLLTILTISTVDGDSLTKLSKDSETKTPTATTMPIKLLTKQQKQAELIAFWKNVNAKRLARYKANGFTDKEISEIFNPTLIED